MDLHAQTSLEYLLIILVIVFLITGLVLFMVPTASDTVGTIEGDGGIFDFDGTTICSVTCSIRDMCSSSPIAHAAVTGDDCCDGTDCYQCDIGYVWDDVAKGCYPHSWHTSIGVCSVECGFGVADVTVWCESDGTPGVHVDESLCDAASKPALTQVCNPTCVFSGSTGCGDQGCGPDGFPTGAGSCVAGSCVATCFDCAALADQIISSSPGGGPSCNPSCGSGGGRDIAYNRQYYYYEKYTGTCTSGACDTYTDGQCIEGGAHLCPVGKNCVILPQGSGFAAYCQ